MTSNSLRVRVAAFLLIPMAALALTLAIGGTWFVNTFVTRAVDRLLAGSILSISERLQIQDGQVIVDLPTAAFGMLSNPERDSIFYNVTVNGAFVTGYEDLPLPDQMPEPHELNYRDGEFRGQRVRVGMLLKPVYIAERAALVQVAQTTRGRDLLAQRMLVALALLGAVLTGVGILLVWLAVRIGLTPLDKLRQQVEQRKLNSEGRVPAFPVADVPQEALPLVTALNDLLAQLNHAMAVMRQFTADASHQLRTPVAILKTHLSLLDRQPPGSRAWTSSRTDIDSAVSRLERLIAQLLTLATVEEEARRRLEPREVDLVAFARDIALDAAVIARQHNIELCFEPPDEPVSAVVDPVLLGEAFRNLVDNAIRYNAEGGSVCVTVFADEGPEGRPQACLAVEDDGPGIPETQRELVFERFYRVGRPCDPGGSGLGLAIVRAFVEKLDGTVSLAVGQGGQGLRATIALDKAEHGVSCEGSRGESVLYDI